MKKVICFLLASILAVVALTGCARDDDEDSEQDELASAVGNLTEVYTIVIYKAPVTVYNDGTLEKLMELTIYEDSNIIKEQFAPESIKMYRIPEEFLAFYSTVSDEEKDFILSLAEFNK